ncbi:hypothetical protein Tco_1477561 [Tanacetum coccineum]
MDLDHDHVIQVHNIALCAFASLYGLRAKALDPPLNPPTARTTLSNLSISTSERSYLPTQLGATPTPQKIVEVHFNNGEIPSLSVQSCFSRKYAQ